MPANISLKLNDNFKNEFDKEVRKELQVYIAKNLRGLALVIKERLREVVTLLIRDSDVYKSIQSLTLLGELGLPDPSDIDDIIEVWADTVRVKFEKTKELGKLEIGIIRSDYFDVLALPSASYTYITENSGGTIEWLRWLLTEGTSPIVLGYEFKKGPLGRTGRGVMVEKTGGSWRIPERFAGTEANNFVIRAMADIEGSIDRVVEDVLTKGL